MLLKTVAVVNTFANARTKTTQPSKDMKTIQNPLLNKLEKSQKRVLSLFAKKKRVTTREIADLLRVHPRTALNRCNRWSDEGFLIKIGEAPKSRKYELADKWMELI